MHPRRWQALVAALLVMQHAWRVQNRGAGVLQVGRPSTHSALLDLFRYFQTHLNLKQSKMVFCK
jgi:hypothetical protein